LPFFFADVVSYGGAHSLKTGWYYIEDNKNDYLRSLDKSDEKYYINPDQIIIAKHFCKVEVLDVKYNDVANQYLLIQFDSIGKKAWNIATGKAINKRLALIIDDKLVYVPLVNAQISSGISTLNRGIYSKAELEAFAKRILMEMQTPVCSSISRLIRLDNLGSFERVGVLIT
jgi:hypothetical protein